MKQHMTRELKSRRHQHLVPRDTTDMHEIICGPCLFPCQHPHVHSHCCAADAEFEKHHMNGSELSIQGWCRLQSQAYACSVEENRMQMRRCHRGICMAKVEEKDFEEKDSTCFSVIC